MSADSNAAAAAAQAVAAADDGREVPPAGEFLDDDVNEEDRLKRRRESSSSSSGTSRPTRKKKSRKTKAALPQVQEGSKNASDAGDTEGDEPDDSLPEGDNLIDAEGVDNTETNAGGGDQWTEVLTSDQVAQIRATKRAERIVRRQTWNTKSSSSGFEVAFAPTEEGKTFQVNDLLKIFSDVRSVVVDAQPRLNAKGGVTVRVPLQSQIESLKGINVIAGIDVVLILPSESTLWGRITGVHPLFSESDLLEALQSQGVEEVVREKYSACESTSASVNTRVQKPSNRVRLRFRSELKSEVTIAHQVHKVTLCLASPLQCLSCCGFGHRAAVYPEKAPPRCRKCGVAGHQLWQCTARARCINCKGAHPSNDSRCPVYAVYAKAARDRFVGKVVAGLDNVAVKESVHIVPGEAPLPASGVEGPRPSFAAVVGKPTMMALVKTSENGDRVVCYLPKPPASKLIRTPEPKKQTLPPSGPKINLDHDALVASICMRFRELPRLSPL